MSAHALIAALPAAQKFEAALQGVHGIQDLHVSMRVRHGDFIAIWTLPDGSKDAVSFHWDELADPEALAVEVGKIIGDEIWFRENPVPGDH